MTNIYQYHLLCLTGFHLVISFIVIVLLRLIYLPCKILSIPNNASDSCFSDNDWSNYMLGGIKFLKKNDKYTFSKYTKDCTISIKRWENQNAPWIKYNIQGQFELSKAQTVNELCTYLENTTPPLINNYLLPYKVFFLTKPKIVLFLLNHYYCDGLVLHDIVVHGFLNMKKKAVSLIDYKYYPVYNDVNIVRYGIKHMIKACIPYRTLTSQSKTTILFQEIPYAGSINRWQALAKTVFMILNHITKDNLRIGFTVGFNDTTSFANNRIGIIILDIPKLDILELEMFLKAKLVESKYDALASYDLIRNFPVAFFREKMRCNIDVIFTSFKIDTRSEYDDESCRARYSNYFLGSFLGKEKYGLPFYILSMTLPHESKIKVSIRCSTPDFDIEQYISSYSGVHKIYESAP